jgi:hypothetical protein
MLGQCDCLYHVALQFGRGLTYDPSLRRGTPGVPKMTNEAPEHLLLLRSCPSFPGHWLFSKFEEMLGLPIFDHHNNDSYNNCRKNSNQNAYKQAPPLLVVARTSTDDRRANFLVAPCDILANVLALLLNVGNERLLLLHNFVEIYEKLGDHEHLALNVLDSLMALIRVP